MTADTHPIEEAAPTNSMITVRLTEVGLHSEGTLPVHTDSTGSCTSSIASHCSSPPNDSETCSIKSVDWEELDKTEEEEARVEGTDEVCDS